MVKASGQNNLILFNDQSDIDRELQKLASDRLFEKLGLEKPAKKLLQKFDIPVIPQQEDFMFFPFRHISATTVGGGSWKATDFSVGNVLKKSTNLLYKKPAYINHNQQVGKAVGTIGEPEWVGSYKHTNGFQIPGGIEAPFILDSKLEPELCRQLSSPVSPIDAASVSVFFEWEASHEFEREGDFYWHIGEEIDGTMVRRIVTNIVDYMESSLVYMGADPYARGVGEKGEIVSIDRASAYSKSKFSDVPELQKYKPNATYYLFDCLDPEKVLHLSKSNLNFNKPKPENIITMNEELLALLAVHFGTTVDALKTGAFKKADAEKFTVTKTEDFSKMKTAEVFTKLEGEKTEAETKLATANTELTKVKGEKESLEQEKKTNESFLKVGKDTLAAAQAEAKRVYGVFAKGKVEKSIEEELEKETDIAKLNAKIAMFGGSAIGQFGAKCTKCGSEEVEFRQSKNQEESPVVVPKRNWVREATSR